jgi:Tol biopolymer transport system component
MGLSDKLVPTNWLMFCVAAILLPAWSTYGNEPQRLTRDGRLKFSPVFINVEELAYTDFVNPTLYRLQRLKLEDRSIAPLHPDAKTSELEPTFSQDGKFYAFVQTKGVLSLSIVIRNLRTKKDAVVPPAPGFAGMRSPVISPDNLRVVYAFAEGGRQHLYSVDMKAGNRKVLTSNRINNWPCFSPDGKQITFSSTRHGNYDIHLMKADGSNVRRLTDNPLQDIRPRFSPDGKRIAFTSHRDGNYEIYIMDTDGSNVRRLTSHPERDDYPTWHPDGKRIAFVAERAGRHDIYLMKVSK